MALNRHQNFSWGQPEGTTAKAQGTASTLLPLWRSLWQASAYIYAYETGFVIGSLPVRK